jgi:hypothetical protein
MIRILTATPLILTGQAITSIGYRLAGAEHLNPHKRNTTRPLRFRETL